MSHSSKPPPRTVCAPDEDAITVAMGKQTRKGLNYPDDGLLIVDHIKEIQVERGGATLVDKNEMENLSDYGDNNDQRDAMIAEKLGGLIRKGHGVTFHFPPDQLVKLGVSALGQNYDLSIEADAKAMVKAVMGSLGITPDTAKDFYAEIKKGFDAAAPKEPDAPQSTVKTKANFGI